MTFKVKIPAVINRKKRLVTVEENVKTPAIVNDEKGRIVVNETDISPETAALGMLKTKHAQTAVKPKTDYAAHVTKTDIIAAIAADEAYAQTLMGVPDRADEGAVAGDDASGTPANPRDQYVQKVRGQFLRHNPGADVSRIPEKYFVGPYDNQMRYTAEAARADQNRKAIGAAFRMAYLSSDFFKWIRNIGANRRNTENDLIRYEAYKLPPDKWYLKKYAPMGMPKINAGKVVPVGSTKDEFERDWGKYADASVYGPWAFGFDSRKTYNNYAVNAWFIEENLKYIERVINPSLSASTRQAMFVAQLAGGVLGEPMFFLPMAGIVGGVAKGTVKTIKGVKNAKTVTGAVNYARTNSKTFNAFASAASQRAVNAVQKSGITDVSMAIKEWREVHKTAAMFAQAGGRATVPVAGKGIVYGTDNKGLDYLYAVLTGIALTALSQVAGTMTGRATQNQPAVNIKATQNIGLDKTIVITETAKSINKYVGQPIKRRVINMGLRKVVNFLQTDKKTNE